MIHIAYILCIIDRIVVPVALNYERGNKMKPARPHKGNEIYTGREKSSPVVSRIPNQLKQRIKENAKRQGISVSQHLRNFLVDHYGDKQTASRIIAEQHKEIANLRKALRAFTH